MGVVTSRLGRGGGPRSQEEKASSGEAPSGLLGLAVKSVALVQPFTGSSPLGCREGGAGKSNSMKQKLFDLCYPSSVWPPEGALRTLVESME